MMRTRNFRTPKVEAIKTAILGYLIHNGGGDSNQIATELHFPGSDRTHITPRRLVPILKRLADEKLIKESKPASEDLGKKLVKIQLGNFMNCSKFI